MALQALVVGLRFGFGVSGIRVQGLGFQGSGFRAWVLLYRLGFRKLGVWGGLGSQGLAGSLDPIRRLRVLILAYTCVQVCYAIFVYVGEFIYHIGGGGGVGGGGTLLALLIRGS